MNEFGLNLVMPSAQSLEEQPQLNSSKRGLLIAHGG
jgi:hypothetical protein